jgi:hypothetical protein
MKAAVPEAEASIEQLLSSPDDGFGDPAPLTAEDLRTQRSNPLPRFFS